MAIEYVRPEDRLQLVEAHVGYYAATLAPSFDLFLRTFGTTTNGCTVELGAAHIADEAAVFAACPTLAQNAAAIVAELTALAVAKGLCPAIDPAVLTAWQAEQMTLVAPAPVVEPAQ